MRVWVNTPAGWIQHGPTRVSEERAAIVAGILARRCGWETSSGLYPPPPRPAGPDAPSQAVAAHSPVAPDCGRSSGEGTVGPDWSRAEVEATVTDYFDMLQQEMKGLPVNKAAHNRRLQAVLQVRSRGAIEFKHQNISAVLLELGYPYVSGYKPRRNYQELLRTVVTQRLAASPHLERTASEAVDAPVDSMPEIPDILSLLVAPPAPVERRAEYTGVHEPRTRSGNFVNWLERESHNRSLAAACEKLVLDFEHRRLWKARRRDLAGRIEHVARTRGDGLGYDILSFESNGAERLIEVKTTRFGPMTPFFASRNEVAVSEERAAVYHIYRLFRFRTEPRMFHLQGSLKATCNLEPVQYAATVA